MEMTINGASLTFEKSDVLSEYLAGWSNAGSMEDHRALQPTPEFEEVRSACCRHAYREQITSWMMAEIRSRIERGKIDRDFDPKKLKPWYA